MELYGLPAGTLQELSYQSRLGRSLKSNLRYFDKALLLQELFDVSGWLKRQTLLETVAADYRIKSTESIATKYERHSQDEQVRKVFNDLLGFCVLCSSYEPVLRAERGSLRVADHSQGKAKDDGYRGVHVYYELDNTHYPIEIQFNTYYDRQINDWLHDFVYKRAYPLSVGRALRESYEAGNIRTEADFEEALHNVLSGC